MSGGLNATSGIENLAPEQQSAAENVRYSDEGGIQPRNGVVLLTASGGGAKVGNIHTHRNTVMFAKSGTKIYQSTDWKKHSYTTGVTRTATEIDEFESVERDVFASNQTDAYLRIAVSTIAAISSGAGTFSVNTGDGEKFSSGTVYIRGTAITGGTLATDDYTGCTGLTSSMAVGDIVTQTSTPSGAPKGACITELEGSTLVGNVKSNPMVIHYSAARTDTAPQFSYDFTANGANKKSMPSDVLAFGKVTGGVLIGLKRGIHFSGGFEVNTGALLTAEKSGVHGVHNARAFSQGDKMTMCLTNTNRILPIIYDQNGVQVMDDPFNKKKNLDYPVRSILDGLDTVQTFSGAFYDPSTSTHTFVVYKNGFSRELVYQEDIGKWSVDIGKNALCKTFYKGRVYTGSDNSDKIYLENEGRDDDGAAIQTRITTGKLTPKPKRITSEYLDLTFGGLCSATGEFTVRILCRDTEITRDVTAAKMIEAGLMTIDSGVFIGHGETGGELIGTGGSVIEAFPFTYSFPFLLEGESIQIQWEITAEGSVVELRDYTIRAQTDGELLLTSQ